MEDKTEKQITEVKQKIEEIKKVEGKKQELDNLPKKKSGLKVLMFVIIALMIFVAGGLAVYFYMYTSSVKKQKQEPNHPPALSQDQTEDNDMSDWQTYKDENLSFKYPNSWIHESEMYRIIGTNPNIEINIAPEDSTLMNECMRPDEVSELELYSVTKFSRVTTGVMCETDDDTPREIWISPQSPHKNSTGISFKYSVIDRVEAEAIFNQLLSTYKFFDNRVTTIGGSTGKVKGRVCFPSDHIPAGDIRAKNIDTNEVFSQSFEKVPPGSLNFSMTLNPATYVFGYAIGGKEVNGGYYTECSKTMHNDNCGTKESHKLIKVKIEQGKQISDIYLCDFYFSDINEPEF
jgi:hypothetical protein